MNWNQTILFLEPNFGTAVGQKIMKLKVARHRFTSHLIKANRLDVMLDHLCLFECSQAGLGSHLNLPN
jgi:hypothetical protein